MQTWGKGAHGPDTAGSSEVDGYTGNVNTSFSSSSFDEGKGDYYKGKGEKGKGEEYKGSYKGNKGDKGGKSDSDVKGYKGSGYGKGFSSDDTLPSEAQGKGDYSDTLHGKGPNYTDFSKGDYKGDKGDSHKGDKGKGDHKGDRGKGGDSDSFKGEYKGGFSKGSEDTKGDKGGGYKGEFSKGDNGGYKGEFSKGDKGDKGNYDTYKGDKGNAEGSKGDKGNGEGSKGDTGSGYRGDKGNYDTYKGDKGSGYKGDKGKGTFDSSDSFKGDQHKGEYKGDYKGDTGFKGDTSNKGDKGNYSKGSDSFKGNDPTFKGDKGKAYNNDSYKGDKGEYHPSFKGDTSKGHSHKGSDKGGSTTYDSYDDDSVSNFSSKGDKGDKGKDGYKGTYKGDRGDGYGPPSSKGHSKGSDKGGTTSYDTYSLSHDDATSRASHAMPAHPFEPHVDVQGYNVGYTKGGKGGKDMKCKGKDMKGGKEFKGDKGGKPDQPGVLQPRRYNNSSRGFVKDDSRNLLAEQAAVMWAVEHPLKNVTFDDLEDNVLKLKTLAKRENTNTVMNAVFKLCTEALLSRKKSDSRSSEDRVLCTINEPSLIRHLETLVATGSLIHYCLLIKTNLSVARSAGARHARQHATPNTPPNPSRTEIVLKYKPLFSAQLLENAPTQSDGIWESASSTDRLVAEVSLLLHTLEEAHRTHALAQHAEWEATYKGCSVDLFEDVFNAPQEIVPAIVESELPSLEWLFDTQFHLLREDFMAPLRTGIQALGRARPIDLWFDQEVRVTGIGTCMWGVVHLLSVAKQRGTRFANDRLKPGSLVCLSDNRFEENSLLWGIVVGMPNVLDAEVRFTAQFKGLYEMVAGDDALYDSVGGMIGDTFDMIESRVFYEAYSHVIRVLHGKPLEDLPFQDILTAKSEALSKENIRRPLSLLNKDIVVNALLKDGLYTEPVYWYTKADGETMEEFPEVDVQLDASQLACAKQALSQEVSIIQGPPGTGKSFVGSRIVRVLLDTLWGLDRDKTGVVESQDNVQWRRDSLREEQMWGVHPDDDDSDIEEDGFDKTPILVLCHTNHALDSVLIDLIGAYSEDNDDDELSYERPKKVCHEDRVLRIGGNTKCNAIKKRNALKVLNSLGSEFELRSAKRQRKDLQARIEEIQKKFSKTSLYTSPDSSVPPAFSSFLKTYRSKLEQQRNEKEQQIDKLIFQRNKTARIERTYHEIEADIDKVRLECSALKEAEANPLASWLEGKGHEIEHSDACDTGGLEEEAVGVARIGNDDEINPDQGNLRPHQYDALSPEDRWKHFDRWTAPACDNMKHALFEVCTAYETACRRVQTLESAALERLLKTARVVGATTTGCAKFSRAMERLQPEIIIVEEAAEVLESHILSVLSPHTKHLLLIGDQKQLQPKVNVMEMEKKGLCVSLMERLVRSGMEPSVLLTQRRMTSAICDVTAPFYLPLRIDTHASTKDHPKKIRGLQQNLYFISHREEEERVNGASPHNEFEGLYSIGLAGHLLRNGLLPTQVTVLVAYKGQFHFFREKVRSMKDVWKDGGRTLAALKHVKVCCVDSFQGEENDIIILNLVRSNAGGRHGFLKKENRLIVALSRARFGMYVLGNMEFLKEASAEWKRVYDDAEERRIMGPHLSIECQRHGLTAPIKSYRDFVNHTPRGGCNKICKVRLECGHECKEVCHGDNYDHAIRVCNEKCGRVGPNCIPPRDCTHQCKKLCETDCGPCNVVVERTLPCGHTRTAECAIPVASLTCREPCQHPLECGHICENKCSQPCTTHCRVAVSRDLPCGHTQDVPCHKPTLQAKCKAPCEEHLACDHVCSKTCGDCRKPGGITVHTCENECKRRLVCGHACNSMCTKMCPPCKTPCDMTCDHSKCDKTCGEPCISCACDCTWKCKHLTCRKRCWEICERPRCDKNCDKTLPCGHPCLGVCGDPCPELCAQCKIGLDRLIDLVALPGDDDTVAIEDDAQYVQLGCKHIYFVDQFDSYINAEQDKAAVQWLMCPTCKGPIQPHHTGRYRAEVNASIISVNDVKKRVAQEDAKFKQTRTALLVTLAAADTNASRDESLALQKRYLKERTTNARFEDIVALQRQTELFTFYLKVATKDYDYGPHGDTLSYLCNEALTHIMTEESMKDVTLTARLHTVLGRLYRVKKKAESTGNGMDQDLLQAYDELCAVRREDFTAKTADAWEDVAKRYEKRVCTDMIADMKIASAALQLGPGHWFKCPNGHLYVIADCGGAVSSSVCPECKAKVGGEGYALAEGNHFAGNLIEPSAAPNWNVAGMM